MNEGPWKCNHCGGIIEGALTYDMLKGRTAHKTPTGAECRAMSFARVFNRAGGRPEKEPKAVDFDPKDMDFTTPPCDVQ